jgi:hypothetical protein
MSRPAFAVLAALKSGWCWGCTVSQVAALAGLVIIMFI